MPRYGFGVPASLSTLVDVVQWRAAQDASRPAFTFLVDGMPVSASLSYRDLDLCARAIGAFLRERRVAGQPVLLCHPPGLEFISALLGCFYAGALAVPAYPPRNRRHVGRIQAIAGDCRARLILTSAGFDRDLREWLAAGGGAAIEVLNSEDIPLDLASEWRPVDRRSDDLAYLQYTSGSTSTPKGVMVTHQNLLANGDAARDGFCFDADSVSVSWLPTFHDMGLVLTVFVPVLTGVPVYQMAPASFLQRPMQWLEAVSRYRGTHSGGPNFAFDLCCERISEEQAATLDLSAWRVAYNGSEQLRKGTLERFSKRFAGAGFSPRMHHSAYGLAEATLVVSAKHERAEVPSIAVNAAALARHRVLASDGESPTIDVIGCGTAVFDTDIAIVEPETRQRRGPDEVGEIWVRGPGVALGYWENPEATAEVFGLRTADGEGPYLRSGDLGAVIDGELYVTGRLKDVIIVRGRNHYPHDIELTVQQADPAVEPHGGAAFSVVLDGEESLVIVQEVKRSALKALDGDRVLSAIRQAVVAEHEIEIADLLLVAPLECPKTSSGKIQHHDCKARYLENGFKVLARRTARATRAATQDMSVRHWLVARISEVTGLPPRDIDPARAFESFGVDSLSAVRFSGELEDTFKVRLSPTALYEHPTIDALSDYVTAQGEGRVPRLFGPAGAPLHEPIAIVGMACRFPGADTPEEFWQLLRAGADRVSDAPPERWNGAGQGAFLTRVDEFDAEFFGIAPREAIELDPQQRLLLEESWSALEHAGISPSSLAGSDAGVFVGISTLDYSDLLRGSGSAPGPYFGTGTAASAAAGRLSYVLGLEGLSMAVDTACSSSLVAVHLAAQSLRAGECRIAIAGAVNLILWPDLSAALTQARMLSPAGRCKTFSADADGYVRGEGCGVVVLKRLSDARAAGDRVLAIVRGTAVNQDGHSNGLAAPNGGAQERVVRSALRAAGVDAVDVGYVEAHGTGTPLGDPIEVAALARAFGARSSDRWSNRLPVYLGSVKTNIGHLEAAAGMAGLIKTVLSLQHAEIPPHLHCDRPNAMIPWDDVPFVVPRAVTPWPEDRRRRIAGVSSFGFVGTNAHVIVEAAEADETESMSAGAMRPSRARHALCLSARSETALAAIAQSYATALDDAPADVEDVCFTAATGRAHLRHRASVAGTSVAELRVGLEAIAGGRSARNVFRGQRAPGANPGPVFLFTGQGVQYAGMGRALYDAEPAFRRAIDECDALLGPHLDEPLLGVLFPEDAADPRIDRTEYTQPALFAVEWALAELWRSWGVTPAAVLGHSIGEYVAACVAGVFDLPDALALVAARGRAMQRLPSGGAMAAVAADESTTHALLAEVGQELAIAAVNAPSQCVVSGAAAAFEQAVKLLESRGIASERLNVSHAFHSPLVGPAAEELRSAFRGVAMRPPRVTLISNVTGGVAAAGDLLRPDYWCRQITNTVRFSDGVSALQELGFRTFLEVGPQPTLISLAQQTWSGDAATWVASLKRRSKDSGSIVDAAAVLYAAGVDVDWSAFYAGRPHRRIALPTYPFERSRYWPAAGAGAALDPTSTRRVSVAASGWLADHRIEGAIVVPGTTYIEAALAAARIATGSDDFELTPLAFDRPLVLAAGDEFELQTRMSRDASGGGTLAFCSRNVSGGDWVQHAAIGFRASPAPSVSASLDALRAASPETISPSDFYAAWSERGNQWGPAFQGIASLRRGRGEAIAEIVAPDAIRAELGARSTHPAILDACVQVLAAAIPNATSGTFVGKGVSAVRVRRALTNAPLWSHATVRGETSGRHVVGDVHVYDTGGELVAEMRGVRFEFIDRDAARAVDPERWLHTVAWTPVASVPASAVEPRHWAIVDAADGTRFAEELSIALEARGQHATVVRGAGAPAFGDFAGTVYAAAVQQSGLESAEEHFASLRGLVAAATRRLTILTRGACTLPGDSGDAPSSGPLLWGLARTLSVEHRDLWNRIIDLDPAGSEADRAASAADALLQPLEEDQIAIRANGIFAPRLTSVDAPRNGRAAFRVDAAYLITGGLGALGLRVAHWMAERGARRLILMGRSGLPARSDWRTLSSDSIDGRRVAAVRAIEQLGADVRIARVDVADAAALSAWLDDYRREDLAPIRGIVHAAGTVSEASLTELTSESLAAQIGAKARGAATLDRLFAGDSLDSFVLFSSASAVLASPRLGAYAAANAFLDAVAASRRARGLPALSIQWGAWAEGGMAAGRSQQIGGVDLIDPEHGLAVLDRLWASPLSTVAVLPVDWEAWRERYAAFAASPLLRSLIGVKARVDDVAIDVDRVRALPDDERRAALGRWLARVVAHVLRLPDAEIDSQQNLGTLGLDSLMALEIRNRIQHGVRVSIPLVELIRGGTLDQMLGLVDQRLQLGRSTETARIGAGELTAHPWPLSHGQRVQWLLHSLDPASASYHVAFAARVTVPLDVDALRRAWRALRERHVTLRMSWQSDGDTVTQRVRAEFADSFESFDASGLDDEALRATVTAAYRQPFDLEHGEPARLHVYSRGAGDHVLLLAAHHIACDGWSLWVLLDDLKELYASLSAGRSLPANELPATYLDFVRAESEILAGPDAERQWAYWQERLAGNLEALDLPLDHPRAARHVRRGASYPIELPEDLTAELRRVAQANGVTLFTVLTAGLNALLHRYTGQSDVLIGTPTAGRNERRFAGVVGHFVNQVVLRSDFADDPSFDTLLARTRGTVLDALANQDIPFPLLVERLRPNRDSNRTPIFDVNLVFQQAQTSGEILGLMSGDGDELLEWGALRLRSYPLQQQEGQFDLTVELLDAGARLVGHLKYDAALFDRETIARFETHFRNLLRAAARMPERRVSTLPLLGGAEREALLSSSPVPDVSVTAPLQELFERQAARTPAAEALSFGDERLTYGELNARANRLAHRLRELGVGPESLVALRLEPGIESVVAILGTLKSGGGYLPIDMSYPDDRAAFMVSDSGARVVIDAEWLRREGDALRGQPATNPPAMSAPDNVAYCIYTSGTTGRPKGVLIEHRQVTRLFAATKAWFEFGASDVWTLFHSTAFDFSVWEIWGALLYGGRVVVVPYLTARSPEAFHRLVRDEGVTILNQTPSAFREFIAADAAAGTAPPSLRTVIFGGEALDGRMLAPWFQRHPMQPRLINMYGITETTVHVTYAPVTAADTTSASPIGRPIPDVQTYVLDANAEPVPIGVRGELYVGGAGLARGYLARPELTAERFVPNPFGTAPGARLYRTGDLGRYRADGTIEYLGRADRQVKIRGFRIERSEIEAELRRHPLVDEAIVLARNGVGRPTTLAAYVVCTGVKASTDSLRLHLRKSLPEYMVPSSIAVLDRLPLTSNGKVDQAALALVDVPQARSHDPVAAPATETERAVAAVWREVLAVEEVGRHDNFFDLGGHSLLVPHVHRRLTERFSSSIAIVDLFRYPTVGDLAQFLAGVVATDDTSAGAARAEIRQARRRART